MIDLHRDKHEAYFVAPVDYMFSDSDASESDPLFIKFVTPNRSELTEYQSESLRVISCDDRVDVEARIIDALFALKADKVEEDYYCVLEIVFLQSLSEGFVVSCECGWVDNHVVSFHFRHSVHVDVIGFDKYKKLIRYWDYGQKD